LDQILSGEATEDVVANIHQYLTEIGEKVRGGHMPLDDFIVFKVLHFCHLLYIVLIESQRLGKNPEDYPDAKSQPHVQVALRMKQRGGSARTGDVISYIFCRAEGEESAKTAQADRAKHPDEIRKAASTLMIGKFLLPVYSTLTIDLDDRLRTLPCPTNLTTYRTSLRAH